MTPPDSVTPPAESVMTAVVDRWPIVGLVLVLAYVLRFLLELAGTASKNLTGARRLFSRTARQDAADDERVVELKEALDIVRGQVTDLQLLVADLTARDVARTTEMNILHRLQDAQTRAIRVHTDWDNTWAPRARAAGIDVPDPPSLHVFLEEPA